MKNVFKLFVFYSIYIAVFIGIAFILLPSNLKLSAIYSLDNINCISEIVSKTDSGKLQSKASDKYIVITFDDGWKAQYEAYEKLKEFNYKATLYICSSLIDKEDRLTLENIEEMYENGWDICNHTVHHTNLTEVSAKKAYEEIYGCSAWIYGHGFTRAKGYKHFAYPEGAYDENIIKMLHKQGFLTARTTNPGSDTSTLLELGRASLYGMDRQNIRDIVLSDQEIIIVSLHRVIPDDAKEVTELDLKESYFDELINAIDDSKRQVVTMTEWYTLSGQDII